MFCGLQCEAPQCWSVGILITNTQHNCFLLSNVESPAPGGCENQLISAPRYFESAREGGCCITVQFNYHGSKFEALKNKKKSGSQLSSHKHSRFLIHNSLLFQPSSLHHPLHGYFLGLNMFSLASPCLLT